MKTFQTPLIVYLGLWFALFAVFTLFYLGYFFLTADWLASYSSGIQYDELGSLLFAAASSSLVVSAFWVIRRRGRFGRAWLAFGITLALFLFFVPILPSSGATAAGDRTADCSGSAVCVPPPGYCVDPSLTYFYPKGAVVQLGSLSSLAGSGLLYRAYYTQPGVIPTAGPNSWPIDGFTVQVGNATVWETFRPPPLSALCY